MSEEINGQQVEIENIANIPVGAAVDGWDATSGTTGDAAYTGSGSATKISILKGIYAGVGGADPASPVVANKGTGSRGWLATIAGLLQLGTQTKANSASVTPASDLANIEPAGAAITAAAMPAGGTGLTGWLSAIWLACTAATPAGTNSIGTVGLNTGSSIVGKVGIDQTTAGTTNGVVVNSSALPTGAAADGADPSSPVVANKGSGIRGWLATIAGLLQLGTQTKAASASVTLASDLANIEPAGAAPTGVAMPAGGLGLTGWLGAVYALFLGGTARIRSAIWYAETVGSNLAASGAFTGAVRTDGSTSGGGSSFGYFQATAWPSRAGTLTVYNQLTSGLGVSIAIAANASGTLKVPNFGGSFQAVFANTDGTAGTLTLADGFTAA